MALTTTTTPAPTATDPARTLTIAMDGDREVWRSYSEVLTPEAVTRQTIEDAARQAIAANKAFVASTPTAAQTTAQVKALSRQVDGVIRLLLGQLDAAD